MNAGDIILRTNEQDPFVALESTPCFLKGDTHGKQGTKRQEGKEKEEEREAKGTQEIVLLFEICESRPNSVSELGRIVSSFGEAGAG
jgi:hypothetical protein